MTVTIPDSLTNKINEWAGLLSQTPEEFIIRLPEERTEHAGACDETVYLAKSEKNRKRLTKAVKDIKSGKYESHKLINDD